MSVLLTADLHLTDRPRDEYRFGLFPWLLKQQRKYKPRGTFILGDLTDFKDRHPSTLVNRIVTELIGLEPPVYILMGNHDYTEQSSPFFEFLNCVEGIHFITTPTEVWPGTYMIPHCKDQAALDKACGIIKPGAKQIMLHQCIDGAVAETGSHLKGLQWPPNGLALQGARALAGDIHKPQTLANGVTYIGAPYHIRFGDTFEPRVLLIDNNERDLTFDSPCKWALTIRNIHDLRLNRLVRRGDQVRLTIKLSREETVDWDTIKKLTILQCKEMGLDLYGPILEIDAPESKGVRIGKVKAFTAPETFDAFCEAEGVPENIKEKGKGLLRP